MRIDESRLSTLLDKADRSHANLFAFPAQSNFSGVKHSLSLIAGGMCCSTNRLDLKIATPDFVAVSFYKMFGYPTGVGCLLIRNSTLPCFNVPGLPEAR